MPVYLKGSSGQQNSATPESLYNMENMGYEYPNGLDLKPGSKLHTLIVNNIVDRAKESYNYMNSRHSSWNQIVRSLSAYTRPDDKTDWEEKQKTSPIIVPITFATLETILTYFVATFLDNPIYRYSGRSPEDAIKALLLQHIIQAQTEYMSAGLALHTQWRDAFAFGFGASAVSWKKEKGSFTNFDVDTGERGLNEVTVFEGNELINIDPFKYLPDPNVPIENPQAGEFVGWFERDNRLSLMRQENAQPEYYFNSRYYKKLMNCTSTLFSEAGGRDNMRDRQDTITVGEFTTPIDVIHMYIDIIPREWKLSDSEMPEKWKFAVGGDLIVQEARPMGLSHEKFPVTVAVPDSDGYSITPTSRLEVLYGLQDTVDWLFSSHIANVRKAINDMIIADPSRVNLNDLANPRAGKIVRTRRQYWGRGVKDVAEQLKIMDVTQGHMKDSNIIFEIMGRISAASDMGQNTPMRAGERVSAEEVKGIKMGSMSRLGKSAMLVSLQSMLPTARMMAVHTQEYMEEEIWTGITGELEDRLAQEFGVDSFPKGMMFPVRPQDIIVPFDVVAHDGAMPGSQDTNAWVQLFQIFGNSPEIAQQFDTVRIFKHIARQMGAKNVEDFIRRGNNTQPQLMADDKVESEVSKGNLVPIGNK